MAEAYATARLSQVLPRRWLVEWMFSWIDQNRRMSLGTTSGYRRSSSGSVIVVRLISPAYH